MKTILKLTLVAALFIAAAPAASAQKFGHVDLQSVVMALPDIKDVEAQLQKRGEELMLAIEEMTVEGNKKVDEYQKTEATLSDTMKKIKQDEINSISQRIQELQTAGREELSNKEAELMEPVIEKARQAVKAVMKEQKLAGVLDAQAFVAMDEAMTVDVTPLVKKHLGIAQ